MPLGCLRGGVERTVRCPESCPCSHYLQMPCVSATCPRLAQPVVIDYTASRTTYYDPLLFFGATRAWSSLTRYRLSDLCPNCHSATDGMPLHSTKGGGGNPAPRMNASGHVTGKYRDRSMQHTCSRHAAWDPHRGGGGGVRTIRKFLQSGRGVLVGRAKGAAACRHSERNRLRVLFALRESAAGPWSRRSRARGLRRVCCFLPQRAAAVACFKQREQ